MWKDWAEGTILVFRWGFGDQNNTDYEQDDLDDDEAEAAQPKTSLTPLVLECGDEDNYPLIPELDPNMSLDMLKTILREYVRKVWHRCLDAHLSMYH